MEVKGTSIMTIPEFIKKKFGQEALEKWIEALPPESQKYFKEPILATKWYPMKATLTDPTRVICDLFYNGDDKGAWESGSFSADWGLNSVYKIFIRFGSVDFILGKAKQILPAYFKPATMGNVETQENQATIQITEFSDMEPILEKVIGGWIQRAIELSGCKDVKVELIESLCNKANTTTFKISWT